MKRLSLLLAGLVAIGYGRVRRRRDPDRPLCAQIRRRVRAPLRHDLGRQ
jgi:hypothetical protein